MQLPPEARAATQMIKALGRPERRVELSDPKVPGLRLRLSHTQASWSLLTRPETKRRQRLTLGEWPQMSVAEARRAARRQAIKRPAGRPRALTAGELVDLYCEARISWTGGSGRIVTRLSSLLFTHWDSPVETLSLPDLAEDMIGLDGELAYTAICNLRSMLDWAIGEGLIKGPNMVTAWRKVWPSSKEHQYRSKTS